MPKPYRSRFARKPEPVQCAVLLPSGARCPRPALASGYCRSCGVERYEAGHRLRLLAQFQAKMLKADDGRVRRTPGYP